jgi:hypothetical protein
MPELTAGINPKMTLPIAALNTLMTNKLANAPEKTVNRGCLVAMMAAMRKVLSPISETRIKVKDCMSASASFRWYALVLCYEAGRRCPAR